MACGHRLPQAARRIRHISFCGALVSVLQIPLVWCSLQEPHQFLEKGKPESGGLMTNPGPRRSERTGISIIRLAEVIPNEVAASRRFESTGWPDGCKCPCCYSGNAHEGAHKDVPYRCRACGRTLSVRKGTAIASSRLPLKKWVWAIYLEITLLKGVSSMKLHMAWA